MAKLIWWKLHLNGTKRSKKAILHGAHMPKFFFFVFRKSRPKVEFHPWSPDFWIWPFCFVILMALQGNMTFRKIWSLVQYGWKCSNFIFGSIWHIWWHLDFGGYSHFWEFSYKNTKEFHLKNWWSKVYMISAFFERDLLMNWTIEGAFDQFWIILGQGFNVYKYM